MGHGGHPEDTDSEAEEHFAQVHQSDAGRANLAASPRGAEREREADDAAASKRGKPAAAGHNADPSASSAFAQVSAYFCANAFAAR